jgi:transposase
MTRPLSNDLRERTVAVALAGESCRSVAARFGVAVGRSVIGRLARLRRPRWAGAASERWSRTAPSLWSGSTRCRT